MTDRVAARHIAAEWASYAEHVLPLSAGPTQTGETRRAFYAGAGSILLRIRRLMNHDGDVTPEDEMIFQDIEAELEDHIADVLGGLA